VQQREETVFEHAERHVGAERPKQLRRALLRRVAPDARPDLRGCRAVPDPGLVARARERGRWQPRREIQQHARLDRHRDAEGARHVPDVERSHAMDSQPRTSAARRRRNGDLRPRRPRRDDPQGVAGGPVADDGAGSARQHGGHEVGVQRRGGVPERVDPEVHASQQPAGAPALDPVAANAGSNQLRMTDPPVLATRDAGDRVE
jgi:hypothetical protein